MKKLSGLLLGTLMLGSANLFAQLPEEDSMSNAKNKMQRDTGMASKNNMKRDTTWRSKSTVNKKDTMPSDYSIQLDSIGNLPNRIAGEVNERITMGADI